ncbi:hypothetical protein A9K97_gp400 [Tokyovirus A1]|uniref:hypothetical protein n=1 Tax=Tokyovirus A1 TaxID=1826170 RepID=UPI0007A990C9|nr:hypothetical protein A9K97_gp400 [Tokyovirus A1]BAU79951.1 hypothetical protein [Tokyovirus A1]
MSEENTFAVSSDFTNAEIATYAPTTVVGFPNEELYAKAESRANDVIEKIQKRIPVPYPLNTQRNFRGVSVSSPSMRAFHTDGEKLYVWDDFRSELSIDEAELVESLSQNIPLSAEYQPYLTNKLLKDLNENFTTLFSWLRESVELVPGSERVQKIQEDFESRQ